jgi:mitogen-activated protein kinase kinase kinase
MLASVLGGDILRGEARVSGSNALQAVVPQGSQPDLWWQIRALRNRSEGGEADRQARRNKIVDTVLEEIDKFTFDETSNVSPIDQVAYILKKLAIVESLYPHQTRSAKTSRCMTLSLSRQDRRAVCVVLGGRSAESAVAHPPEMDRYRTTSISRAPTLPRRRLSSASLDTTHWIVRAWRRRENDLAADDSTFVDRILKEDSLRRTFEKRVFVHQIALIQNAKQTVISYSPVFAELKIPTFNELERIISFPGRLIIEALKTRLSAAGGSQTPTLSFDDMAESLRHQSPSPFHPQAVRGDCRPDPERAGDPRMLPASLQPGPAHQH